MKQLTIVVKPFRAEAVLKAVSELDVIACVVQEAKGYSRQKGYLERYLGSEYSMAFLPKVEISVWVSDARIQEVTDRIVGRYTVRLVEDRRTDDNPSGLLVGEYKEQQMVVSRHHVLRAEIEKGSDGRSFVGLHECGVTLRNVMRAGGAG